jgi:colanic acid biosynthesis glycosyl transferase WcaI
MNYKKKKTLLILSQFFWPEKFRINELAIKLNKKYKVKVITSIPNYPIGSYFKNYGNLKNRNQLYKNIEIQRVITYPRKNGNSLNLFLNYFTFNFFSLFKIISSKKDIDCIFIPATSPLTQSLAAILLKKFF